MHDTKICLYCSKSFTPGPGYSKKRAKTAKFCSVSCGNNYRWKYKIGVRTKKMIKKVCPICSKIFYIWPYQERAGAKTCSRECSGKKFSNDFKGKFLLGDKNLPKGQAHFRWKGGPSKYGRYKKYKMPEHPFCDKQGYVIKHRIIMEQHLGRYLKPEEVVHHINGNTFDNRLENLQLFPNASAHLRFHCLHPKI